MIAKLRCVRDEVARGHVATTAAFARAMSPTVENGVSFDLPWPWGGERFELTALRPLTYITGPLGSGKTRFLRCLAENLPRAVLLDMDRLENRGGAVRERLNGDPALKARVDRALTWLDEDGATISNALIALLAGLEDAETAVIAVDMIEQGLDQPTQEALIAYLRRCGPAARSICMTTRSSAILDLDAIGPDETILYCPANHSPPMRVVPHPGAPGYETLAKCVASPAVRARTDGLAAIFANTR
nr:MerR family transcriptional regulator [Hyphomicrobiales bacterium]